MAPRRRGVSGDLGGACAILRKPRRRSATVRSCRFCLLLRHLGRCRAALRCRRATPASDRDGHEPLLKDCPVIAASRVALLMTVVATAPAFAQPRSSVAGATAAGAPASGAMAMRGPSASPAEAQRSLSPPAYLVDPRTGAVAGGTLSII